MSTGKGWNIDGKSAAFNSALSSPRQTGCSVHHRCSVPPPLVNLTQRYLKHFTWGGSSLPTSSGQSIPASWKCWFSAGFLHTWLQTGPPVGLQETLSPPPHARRNSRKENSEENNESENDATYTYDWSTWHTTLEVNLNSFHASTPHSFPAVLCIHVEVQSRGVSLW